jgi:hypothetical protein
LEDPTRVSFRPQRRAQLDPTTLIGAEWRNPEDVSFTMLRQGILTKNFSSRLSFVRGMDSETFSKKIPLSRIEAEVVSGFLHYALARRGGLARRSK